MRYNELSLIASAVSDSITASSTLELLGNPADAMERRLLLVGHALSYRRRRITCMTPVTAESSARAFTTEMQCKSSTMEQKHQRIQPRCAVML